MILIFISRVFCCDGIIGVIFCYDYIRYICEVWKFWDCGVVMGFLKFCHFFVEPCSIVRGIVQNHLFYFAQVIGDIGINFNFIASTISQLFCGFSVTLHIRLLPYL